MKHSIGLALIVSLAVPGSAQELRNAVSRSLFADQKGYRVGDAVTVIVVETSSASNDVKTSASRESNLSFSGSGKIPTQTLPDVGVNIGSGNTFRGEGGTMSRGSVRAKVSARIDTVFANGDFSIKGYRTIIINGKEQIIRISGIVRPSDVLPDNSVYSFNIAEAIIQFEGSGIVDRSQEPGWLTRLFHWIF